MFYIFTWRAAKNTWKERKRNYNNRNLVKQAFSLGEVCVRDREREREESKRDHQISPTPTPSSRSHVQQQQRKDRHFTRRRFEICHRMTPCPKTNTISDWKSNPKRGPPVIFGGLGRVLEDESACKRWSEGCLPFSWPVYRELTSAHTKKLRLKCCFH